MRTPDHVRSCKTSRTAGTARLSFSNSDSRRASRRLTVSSRFAGFSGVVGTPVQSVAPVRRYVRRRRRSSRSSMVAPATASLSVDMVCDCWGSIGGIVLTIGLRIGARSFLRSVQTRQNVGTNLSVC